MCNGQKLMRRIRGAFEFDLIAFRIVEVDRRSIPFRAVALNGFADRYAKRRQPGDDGVTIERRHAKAEMVHVGRSFATLAGDKVEHRGAGPHLHEADPLDPPLDAKSQRLLVEMHHCREIADPQHHMVDSFDMESHGD